MDKGRPTSNEIFDLNDVLDKYRTELAPGNDANSELHFLQGICYGLLGEEPISKRKLERLKVWVEENPKVNDQYPFNQISPFIDQVLTNGEIDLSEQDKLKNYFSEILELDYA